MMKYSAVKEVKKMPRLPLKGSLDLTYRCNNDCRHCWLRIPADSPESKKELSVDEIKKIVDEARKMGCREWFISGGEPMLRQDFAEIFDYITRNSVSYILNTNGTLITPKIAQLLKKKGSKLIAFYGATADVHDHITRRPGSFEELMRGIAYLKEAGVGFTVQIVPMKDNYHQYKEMIKLAESLSSSWRIGASWLYLSAYGDEEKNLEIKKQRLDPAEVVKLNPIGLSVENLMEEEPACYRAEDDGLFTICIANRRDFHVDPYGQMSFCCYIKDPVLRYDLKKGHFQHGWDSFIPSLGDKVKGGKEYLENCGACKQRQDCFWCPVFGYLEHRRYSAKVEYLCAASQKNKKCRENLDKLHRRFYRIAGMTVQVDSDLPITEKTFQPKFKLFETQVAGEDNIRVSHYFHLPPIEDQDLGMEYYRKPPWAIFKKGNHWIYLGIYPDPKDRRIHRVVVFNHDHTKGLIYHKSDKLYHMGNLPSVTLFPSDLILLSRILADRQGLCLHSSGVVFAGHGLLFAGQSGAGKSTIIKLLMKKAKILCDDRMIIRRWPEGIKIHGTWSHGEIPEVSPGEAPLRAIFFLEKSKNNRLERIENKRERISKILARVIKPFLTGDWWDSTLMLVEKISTEVPCYRLYFDRSGGVVSLIEEFCSQLDHSSRTGQQSSHG